MGNQNAPGTEEMKRYNPRFELGVGHAFGQVTLLSQALVPKQGEGGGGTG